jgi:magnesium transporter
MTGPRSLPDAPVPAAATDATGASDGAVAEAALEAALAPHDPRLEPGGTRLRAFAWRVGESLELTTADAIDAALADEEVRLWLDFAAPSHAQVAAIADLLGLHPLVAEDIVERNQRAKLEEIDGDLHLVLFAIAYEGGVREIEIDIVLGRRTLLTVHDPCWDPLSLPQLRTGVGHLLARGPDFLLYAIADGIVDAYFPVLDKLGDEIDQLQDDVVEHPTSRTLQRLFVLKRELIGLRRATSPAREIFNQLTNRDLGLVAAEHIVYFRDVYDHLIRVTDEIDNDRELVGGTLEVYLSTVSNNLSLIMKRLTGVTVILAGMGALAGIFGMSEAGVAVAGGEPWGFWLVAGGIAAIAAVTVAVLRRIDWI